MLTEKDYCDYDTCVALKELGFNGFSQGTYDISGKLTFRTAWLDNRRAEFLGLNVIAPHLYDAQKWLREKKIYIDVIFQGLSDRGNYQYDWVITQNVWFDSDNFVCNSDEEYSKKSYHSYEEALLEGIKEAINILKEDNNGN